MEYVNVQGSKIPSLGFGTWQIKGEECKKAVKNAVDIGYRHIDTAQVYGNEENVGRGIQLSDVPRENIWLTTKLWRTNLNENHLGSSVEQSLEKLQTNYVDLLLVHWPFEEMNLETVLKEMADLVDEGKAMNIGISNFNTEQMERAREISEKPLLTNQVEYHPLLNQQPVLENCRNNDMMLTAYSPLARGRIIGNDTLKDIGEKYGKSEPQIALRWLIQQKNLAAIPKAASREHQKANFHIFDFELTKKEMDTISRLTSKNKRQVDPEFGPEWD